MSVKPVRIQRKRTAGYDMQAASRAINGLACISVTRPGRWGNPFDVGKYGRELSLAVFRDTAHGVWSPSPLVNESDEICDAIYESHHAWLKRLGGHPLELMRSELRGHNLACYCKSLDTCHADVYLSILYGVNV